MFFNQGIKWTCRQFSCKYIYFTISIVSLFRLKDQLHPSSLSTQVKKKKEDEENNIQARHFRNEVSFLSSAASTGTQTHSLVAAKVTNLLVWVQEIRFGKQSGAASRQKSPAAPASGCLRSGRSACWSPRPAAALRSLGKYWPRLGSFSRVFLQSKLFPLITPATCLSPESSLL